MFSAVNGVRVGALTLVIPARGLWVADVLLNQPLEDGAGVTLTLAGLTLRGKVERGGNFLLNFSARIVGGNGGWEQVIPSRPYQNPFGVKLKSVVTDAASAAGESVNVTADRDIGLFYVRKSGPASRVLNQLAPQWWVDSAGVAQVGPRATPTVTSYFDVLAEGTSLRVGRVAIATDKPEDWHPGVMFSAPTIPQQMQAATVVHRLDSDKFRTTVWTSP